MSDHFTHRAFFFAEVRPMRFLREDPDLTLVTAGTPDRATAYDRAEKARDAIETYVKLGGPRRDARVLQARRVASRNVPGFYYTEYTALPAEHEPAETRECGVCTGFVTADEEGSLDCPHCGAHLESRW